MYLNTYPALLVLLSSVAISRATVTFFYDEHCEHKAGPSASQLETDPEAILPGVYGANSLVWEDDEHANDVCGRTNTGPAELLYCNDAGCDQKWVATIGDCISMPSGAWATYLCPMAEPQKPPTPPPTTTLDPTTVSGTGTVSTTETATYTGVDPWSTSTQIIVSASATAGGGGGGGKLEFAPPTYQVPNFPDPSISTQMKNEIEAKAKAATDSYAEAQRNGLTAPFEAQIPVGIQVTINTEIFDDKGNKITGKYQNGDKIGESGRGKGGGGSGGEKCDSEEENKEGCEDSLP